MLFYFIPHAVYHLMRWFPKNNRLKIRLFLIICVCIILAPEIYVFVHKNTLRYCGKPLLEFLAASICFTLFMIGFSVLFSLMDPVPYQIKVVFHFYGAVAFAYSIAQSANAFQAIDCVTYSPELYWYSYIEGLISLIFIGFFFLVVPFWIINKMKKNSVLDEESRTGLCYEPVNCCSCVWHI